MLGLNIFIVLLVFGTASADFSNLSILTYDDIPDESAPKLNMSSYIKLDKKYYYFSPETKPWIGAAMDCRKNNGHLATIANKKEMQVLRDYLLENGKSSDWWVSYTDQGNEGIFTSIADGTILNLTVGVEHGLTRRRGEDCMILWNKRNYVLSDHICTSKLKFICQISNPKTVSFTVW